MVLLRVASLCRCNHCQQLAAPYEEVAKKLRELDPPVKIAKIDAHLYRTLADKHGIKGYPHFFVYRKGREEEYKGMRSFEGEAQFIAVTAIVVVGGVVIAVTLVVVVIDAAATVLVVDVGLLLSRSYHHGLNSER